MVTALLLPAENQTKVKIIIFSVIILPGKSKITAKQVQLRTCVADARSIFS
jgi:hypothetical protein